MVKNSYSDEDLLIAARLYEDEQFDEAFLKFLNLAERGSIESQVLLGWMYLQGQGVHKDEEEAFQRFLCSAQGGSAEGAFNLAKCYARRGQHDLAFDFYQRAAEKDFTPAWVRLGRMYETGKGITHDLELAYACYEKAALKNHMFGLKHLALLLLKGHRGAIGRMRGTWLFIKALYIAVRIGSVDPESEFVRI